MSNFRYKTEKESRDHQNLVQTYELLLKEKDDEIKKMRENYNANFLNDQNG